MVGYFKPDHTVLSIKPDAKELVFARILEGVIDQVNERPRDGLTIHFKRRKIRLNVLFQRKSLLFDLISIRVERVTHQFSDISFAELILLAARFNAREVENVID